MIILFCKVIIGQNKKLNDLDSVFYFLKSINYEKAKEKLEELERESLNKELITEINTLIYFSSNLGVQKKSEEETNYKLVLKDDEFLNSLKLLNNGLFHFYYKRNFDSEAIKSLNLSLKKINSIGYSPLKKEILKTILEYQARYFTTYDDLYKSTLEELESISDDVIDKNISDYYKFFFIRRNSSQEFENKSDVIYYERLINKKIPNFYKGNIYKHIAIHYQYTKEYNKAIPYYRKALNFYDEYDNGRYIEKNISTEISFAVLNFKMKKFNIAMNLLNKIKINNLKGKLIDWNMTYYTFWKSRVYRDLNKIDSAHYYLDKSFFLNMALNQEKHIDEISNMSIKYQTEKKEKQILIEQQEKKRNRNLFYGTSILLILGGTIAYLNLKNSRKKRLLAEQQKELEKQKNLTLIKEQEIHTINAMIDGQEKERIRIAEDLHDNIGSVLATLKLHFENLKLNREKKHFNQEELYNKTEKLIDETYLKVRSIAHAKNAGVIANQGLLVAIKIMAEKISAANQIKIYVVDYGLDNRLENSMEITVFRIIQELTTNIIKHANASEATINISQFDNSLNIIIEDDGKGFDVENTTFKSGIGIASIQKRIQHLQGTFQIDSTLEKGTSIIINIPIMNT
ncbi:sensor histidine kinase [Tenacibaculum sp. M341]|uniref:sensor histidine kinase n=1 Tax=Tenacibaculum sp. M341 TaxID=2530339 RepID=UPI0010518AAD|nr:sensor histidine kinase [Tenacibaculum sp. M341]TCI94922.1 hypothetical protein EYW44_00960 [Tenacibaculum sp. M341]